MSPIRRKLLRTSAATLAGVFVARRALAQAKATKAAMQCQPGATGTCKVVAGPINPKGWCAAFVKKA